MPDCEIWVRAVDNAGNASGWSRGRLAVSSISLTGTTVSVGQTATITRSINPSGASNQNLTWSSSNTSVATVNSSGVVTGVATGTATITATSQDGRGASGSCTVTVRGISLKASTTSTTGSTLQLTATTVPSGQTVTWETSNKNIAAVSSAGKVTRKAAGTATITAKLSTGETATATIKITKTTGKCGQPVNGKQCGTDGNGNAIYAKWCSSCQGYVSKHHDDGQTDYYDITTCPNTVTKYKMQCSI